MKESSWKGVAIDISPDAKEHKPKYWKQLKVQVQVLVRPSGRYLFEWSFNRYADMKHMHMLRFVMFWCVFLELLPVIYFLALFFFRAR